MISLLYPRLNTHVAFEIRQRLRVATAHNGEFDRDLLEDLYNDSQSFPPSGGARVTLDALLQLRDRCLSAVRTSMETADVIQFDKSIGKELWLSSQGATGEFGEPQVWDFLTLALLPDLALHRFPPTTKEFSRRITGGDRRHVFQRLWKRWKVLGQDIVEEGILQEDEYGNIFERRLSRTSAEMSRRIYEEVAAPRQDSTTTRVFTRLFMRQLVQVSGVVHIDTTDPCYLDEIFKHVRHRTEQILAANT